MIGKNMNFNNVKAIFLDLDNTLYEYEACNEYGKKHLFQFLATKLNVELDAIEANFEKARTQMQSDLKNLSSCRSRVLYIQKTIELLLGFTDFHLTLESHELFWEKYFEKMFLFPNLIEFLELAKNKGLQLVIVTDLLADIQMKKIIHLKLDKYIDFLVTSEEAGIEKPHAKMFQLALEKAQLKVDEVIMIGDSQEKDIQGACSLGINTFKVDLKQKKSFYSSLQKILFAQS